MTETFKPIPGYEDRYEVSDQGNVRSIRRGITIKPYITGGYKQVNLHIGNDTKRAKVHRLMLLAFVGPPPIGRPLTRHLDGDPLNLNLSNLAWGSHQENSDDKNTHGTMCRGVDNGASKLTPHIVKFIRHLLGIGLSQQLIADIYEVSQPAISSIARGQTWSHI